MSETYERVDDRLLRNGQYLLLSYSDQENPAESMFTGFRVAKHNVTNIYYNLATEIANFQPMAPLGAPSTTGLSPNYQDKVQFSLNEVQNVQDIWRVTKKDDAYQVFYGLSPSYVRVMLNINQQFTAVLEQNIYPSPTFTEMGIDGFESPLTNPSAKTEFIVFEGMNYTFTLMNISTIPIIPSFNFVVNRMTLVPLRREEIKKAILAGFPIRSFGAVTSSIPISMQSYPGLERVSYREIYG